MIKNVRILLNRNVDMSPGKAAAQAVHAALLAYGIEHGSVVVLQGSRTKIEGMAVQVHDAGLTEIEPGTLTAGASLEERVDEQRARVAVDQPPHVPHNQGDGGDRIESAPSIGGGREHGD